jgi:hypothetical protein
MKKIFIILCLIFSLTIFILYNKNPYSNPYSGNYINVKAPTIHLILKTNDSFSMIETMDKFANYYYGKYRVKNNIIALNFNNYNLFDSTNKPLIGEVDGSRITFKKLNGYFQK